MSARRILLLVTDLEIGGTPTVVRELARRLHHPPDVSVEVACLGRFGPVAEQIRDLGMEVTALHARGAWDIRVFSRLIQLIRAHKFDTVYSLLVHANTAAAIAARFFSNVRFIQSVQTTQPNPRWHWWMQRLVHHAAELVVVPSPSAATAAHQWADVPKEKLVVIPNAIDLSPLPPGEGQGEGAPERNRAFRIHSPPHPSPLPEGEGVTIGFVGRLDPIKRIPDLLAAMTYLPREDTLQIWGEGAERERIVQEIDRLGLQGRVTLHTGVGRDAMRGFDLLVLPSQAEGFGLVLIEAMAEGVPVIATDAAGIRDVVKHEFNGLLVPIAAPQSIATAIQRIKDDPHLRERLVENGRNEVRAKYTWDRVLSQYRELFRLT